MRPQFSTLSERRGDCTNIGAICAGVNTFNNMCSLLNCFRFFSGELNPSSNGRSLACKFLEGKGMNLCAALRCAGR